MADIEAGASTVVGEPRPNDRVRLLVVGDAGVGKSSFVHLVCHGAVLRGTTATVGCSVDAKLHGHSGVSYFVEFVEIGGAEKWRVARSVFFMQRFDGVIMLHDLTNRNSRANLDRWRRELAESRADDSHSTVDDGDDDGYASVGPTEDRRIDDACDTQLHRVASAGASLNRRQSAMPGAAAEEEWVEAGEMGWLPCLTIGTKLDLLQPRATAGPLVEASLTAPSLDMSCIHAFFARAIEHKRGGGVGR